MSRLSPISRRALIARLRKLGFEGPYAGRKHELMVRGTRRLVLPNVHARDIGIDLLQRVLRQAGVSREEWQSTD
jgi:predicted RNA binding protein YcfA (HicA-like mRNA interferase family)